MGGNKDLPFVHYHNLHGHHPLQECPPLRNLKVHCSGVILCSLGTLHNSWHIQVTVFLNTL